MYNYQVPTLPVSALGAALLRLGQIIQRPVPMDFGTWPQPACAEPRRDCRQAMVPAIVIRLDLMRFLLWLRLFLFFSATQLSASVP
jgi:hypothetical protein